MIDRLYDKCVRAKLLPYNPPRYWDRRGGDSYVKFGNAIPVDRVVSQVNFFRRAIEEAAPVNRLLDFGCGTGRMFPVWADIPHVYAYDIAESQRAVAQQVDPGVIVVCPNGSGPNILPLSSSACDVVASCEVLLHIKPENLLAMLMDIVRVLRPGGRFAVITAPSGECDAGHNFNHDYPAAFEAAGLSLLSDEERYGQRYLVGRK